ncbi:MAG: hypothetical protein PF569_06710 [Candidatus Woesearchaeota archaeon]|jgi:hypothetical protein|nr:hypothetical protein [Candidatus Woesearchaeota archaeon]
MVEILGYLHKNKKGDLGVEYTYEIYNNLNLRTPNIRLLSQKLKPSVKKLPFKSIESYISRIRSETAKNMTSEGKIKIGGLSSDRVERYITGIAYQFLGFKLVEDPINNENPILALLETQNKFEEEDILNTDYLMIEGGFDRLVLPRRTVSLIEAMCNEKTYRLNYKNIFQGDVKGLKKIICPKF